MNPAVSSDVPRIMLVGLLIGLLLAGSFWTLLPFLGGLLWATTIVVATWPALLFVQRRTGGRRAAAVTIMTMLVLLAFIVPFALAVSTLLDAAGRSPALLRDFMARGLGPPPSWLAGIPGIGVRLVDKWQTLAAGGPEALVEAVRPYTRSIAAWTAAATGGFGIMILYILLTVVLVAVLYSKGEIAARGMLAVAYRIGRQRGEEIVHLAGAAVRSVAVGVVATALAQSILAGLGLWLSGVPHAGVLTALMFIMGIAQLGPFLVLAPAIAWLYWTGATGWGTALLAWSVPVIVFDNVLRPLLIRRGVQLPMLLILAGVIGGLIGFGVVGLFLGPVTLAATYTLAKAWVAEDQ
jgi:predicted PurR-regulated permease PerM